LSSGFDSNAGNVFCRNLARNYMLLDIQVINNKTHPSLVLDEYVWITHFDCKGYEESLWDCNNTLATTLTKFDINQSETVQVRCQPALEDCMPFSVMITEETLAEPEPRVIAPWIDPSHQGFEYIGCFETGEDMHIQHWFEYSDQMTPLNCWMKCARRMASLESEGVEYNVFVIRKGAYCGCGGKEYGKYGLVEEDQCDIGCLGNLQLMQCGGSTFYSAFEIEWYIPMLLEPEKSTVITVEDRIVEGRGGQKGDEVLTRGFDEFEYYYSLFSRSTMSANQKQLVLPTQRGFVVDRTATYKIWYGENLRRFNFEDNIGHSCVKMTVDLHDHPMSWLEDERNEVIDDESNSQLDYNELFL